MAKGTMKYKILGDSLQEALDTEVSKYLNRDWILAGPLGISNKYFYQPMVYYPPIITHDIGQNIRIDKAPTDTGLPELDMLCKQYNNGDIGIASLVCSAWNTALDLGRKGG